MWQWRGAAPAGCGGFKVPGMTRACGRGQVGATRPGSEERSALGDYAVTTPFVICRNWSALHGEGYALGPELVRGCGR